MKITKPTWINDHVPIITCDIHPDGSRFALGGNTKDAGGGKIQIWNMDPVLQKDRENNPKCQKLLCSLYNHMACVNCVRWSLSGKYLASGADDRLVMIWSFGGMVSKDGVESENWKCIHRLQAHEADVIDLAWNRNDKFLASCSLDNSIIIWNSSNKFEKVNVLKGHTNFVKGVTWDPVGSYLASQSTDNTVRVWNTVDWTMETIIEGPFSNSSNNGHVMRIGWSPDGTYIIAGGAINNGGPTAQIINRKWQLGFDLVGHKKSISCARFAPTCRYKPKSKDDVASVLANDANDATPCCAIGSRDRSISVWLTSLKRPLVVIHDLFEDSILDLTWDSKGQILMATSWDGTIAVIEFRLDEIGEQMTFKAMTEMLEKHYGSSLHDISDIVIENPAMMHLKNKTKIQAEPVIPRGPKTQIVTKRKDGKKRITPAFIGGITSSTPKPFGTKETNTFFPPKSNDDKDDGGEAMEVDENGKIVKNVEKDDKEQPVDGQEMSQLFEEKDSRVPVNAPEKVIGLTKDVADKNKDGKSEEEKTEAKQLSFPTKSVVPQSPQKSKPKEKPKEIQLDFNIDKPEERAPEKKNDKKRKREKKEEVILQAPPSKSVALTSGKSGKTDTLSQIMASESESEGRDSTKRAPEKEIIRHTSVLSPLLPDKISLKECSDRWSLNVKTESNLTKLSRGTQPNLIWQCCLDRPIVKMIVHEETIFIYLEDGEICFINYSSGNRKRTSQFHGILSYFDIHQSGKIIILNTQGGLLVKDLKTNKVIIKCNVDPLLSAGKKFQNIWFSTEENTIFVRIKNGGIYLWNQESEIWIIYRKTSSFVFGILPDNDNIKDYIYGTSLQSISEPSHTPSSNVSECMSGYLENQLNFAVDFKNGKNYKKSLLKYVHHLVQFSNENRLREICDDLLGPVHSSDSDWDPNIFGNSKMELLQGVLSLLGSNLRLQRLYTEYEDMIEQKKQIMSEINQMNME